MTESSRHHGTSGEKPASRRVVLVPATEVRDHPVTWAWTHDGRGRIPTGAVTIFAGRPSAGKSTAARYFAAQVTRGTLPGAWYGTPRNVAYIIGEEPRSVVKAGLRAASADLSRVTFPEVRIGEDRSYQSLRSDDVHQLAAELTAHDVALVVIDPLIGTFTGKTDTYRGNEVRAGLNPWRQLAEETDAVIIGIAHFVKNSAGDLLAAISGASAFGEVARAMLAFVVDNDGTRIMSQGKNSFGVDDLSLRYQLVEQAVITDDGPGGRQFGSPLRCAGERRRADHGGGAGAGETAGARPLPQPSLGLNTLVCVSYCTVTLMGISTYNVVPQRISRSPNCP